MATKAKPLHPLDALATGNPLDVIALMLWKNRHREPDMFVQIDEQDMAGLQASMAYQKVKPAVLIHRPQGLEATPAIPATAKRRATPARAATPPKDYVIVTLVEAGTENVVRSIENNQADYDHAQERALQRKAVSDAPHLADRLINMANSGEYSLSEMTDAAECLRILARSL